MGKYMITIHIEYEPLIYMYDDLESAASDYNYHCQISRRMVTLSQVIMESVPNE